MLKLGEGKLVETFDLIDAEDCCNVFGKKLIVLV